MIRAMPPLETHRDVALSLALVGALACDAGEAKGPSVGRTAEPTSEAEAPSTSPEASPAAEAAPASAEPSEAPAQPPAPPLPPPPAPPEPLDAQAQAAHAQVLAYLGDGFQIHTVGSRRFIASDGLDITTGYARYELDGDQVMGLSGDQRVVALDRSRRALALNPKASREELHAAVAEHLGPGFDLSKLGATTSLRYAGEELAKAHQFWVHEDEVWAKLGATRWLVIDRYRQVHRPVEASAPAGAVRKPMPLKLSVSAAGCSVMGAEPRDCSALCDDADAFQGVDTVIIDASDDAKPQLDAIVACLGAKPIATSVRGAAAATD